MPALRPSRTIRLFWRAHRWLFDVSDGRLGSKLMDHKILKLTTTGRRSGEPRVILIYYFPYQSSYLIVGSYLGSDRHPAWYLNLQANPSAEVQIGRKRMKVKARTAIGEEREQLWAMITASDPVYSEYQAQTERPFPLVVLDPNIY